MKTKKESGGQAHLWNAVILLTVAVAAGGWFLISTLQVGEPESSDIQEPPDIPGQVIVTVPWNPHSIADTMIRSMAGDMDTQVTVENVTGANGATGANAVFSAVSDGTSLLSTNLSAFVTSESMGFGQSSHRDWAAWLCAFSPAIITVTADSPYHTIGELIEAARQDPGGLRSANPGLGTAGFVAAELFRICTPLEFQHFDYAGSSPAIHALLNSEVDFAILLSIEVTERLRSGELRALGAFSVTDFTLSKSDGEIVIPSLIGVSARLDATLPFGEFYGLLTPADVPEEQLYGLDVLVDSAVAEGADFASFISQTGLAATKPDRNRGTETMERMASLMCWTLYDVGYLPTNPNTLGMPRLF